MSALTDATNTIVPEKDTVEKTEKIEETTTETAPVVETTVEAADAEPTEKVSEELTSEEKQKKYAEHLVAGRRSMKTNALDQATEAFSLAAALAADLHGDATEHTFEANYLYGKALLELSKVDEEVLAKALNGIPKEDGEVQDDVVEDPDDVPEEERDEIKQKVEEALDIKEADEETAEEQNTEEEKVEEIEESKEDPTEDADTEATEESEEQEDPEAEDGSEADEEEPIRLAWELLETCRCTCEKKLHILESEQNIDNEAVQTWRLNLAEVLTSLGEHGMINAKYEQAQKDLKEAVAIQTAHLPATSRILANTTHLLAKAYHLDEAFEEAATLFSDCKNILIAKTEELKKLLETTEEKTDIEAEIKELEEVIPELDVFVKDARASAEQTEQIKEAAKKELAAAAECIAKLCGEETKDITDMVRRPNKRPAEEQVEEETKKQKSEELEAPVTSE